MLKVQVPATTANLGPGYDALGMALNIYNTVTVESSPRFSVTVNGEGAGNLPEDESNLVIQAAQLVFKKAGYHPGELSWVQNNSIPLESGMGSSAAAIVAGLTAANALLPQSFSREEIFYMAATMEKHPDNVSPAIFGGLTVAFETEEGFRFLRVGTPAGLYLALAVPDIYLSTEDSRRVLPEKVSREDAVFNVGRTAALLTALMKEEGEHLFWACQDRLHQPHRLPLLPGAERAMKAAIEAGAQGCALSGAGPGVIALWLEKEKGAPFSLHYYQIASAMEKAFLAEGVSCRVFSAQPDPQGVFVYKE